MSVTWTPGALRQRLTTTCLFFVSAQGAAKGLRSHTAQKGPRVGRPREPHVVWLSFRPFSFCAPRQASWLLLRGLLDVQALASFLLLILLGLGRGTCPGSCLLCRFGVCLRALSTPRPPRQGPSSCRAGSKAEGAPGRVPAFCEASRHTVAAD